MVIDHYLIQEMIAVSISPCKNDPIILINPTAVAQYSEYMSPETHNYIGAYIENICTVNLRLIYD